MLPTQAALLEINARSSGNRQVHADSRSVVWTARASPSPGAAEQVIVALFNTAPAAAVQSTTLASLGVPPAASCACADLWEGAACPRVEGVVNASVPAHGVALLALACA